MKIGKKLTLFTVRFMIIIIICVTLTRYLGLPVFLFERHQPHHFDDFFFFPCRYFTVKLRILKITQTNPYALSYSRVWNKSRDKFIIFWFFSRGLRPFKGGHVYKLFGFLFFWSFFLLFSFGYVYQIQNIWGGLPLFKGVSLRH